MSRSAYVRVARHAGLRQAEALVQALLELEGAPEAIAATLRAHQLVGLVVHALPEGELERRLPAATARAIRERAVPVTPVATLVHGFEEARVALAAAGIELRVLKGFVLAERLYGGLAARPQHDLDLLVRRRAFGRARAVLRRLGFDGGSRDLHSRTLSRGPLKIDLHWCLRWAPAFRIDEARVWAAPETVKTAGISFETLSDEWTLVLLALGAFEDLGQGMAKLKQLLDLYLYLRRVDGQRDWAAFFAARETENLGTITATVFALTLALFEAQGELPRLAAALPPAAASRALDLVFAPRKSPESLRWFADVYPGSLAHYLAWFWLAGFPANLRNTGAARPLASLKLALSARRRWPPPPA